MRRLLSLTFTADEAGLRHWSLLWESNGIGRPVDGATYCAWTRSPAPQLQLHNLRRPEWPRPCHRRPCAACNKAPVTGS